MHRSPGEVMKRLCSGARSILVAAPYIKADALLAILADVSSTASVTCVTRWSPHDIVAGVFRYSMSHHCLRSRWLIQAPSDSARQILQYRRCGACRICECKPLVPWDGHHNLIWRFCAERAMTSRARFFEQDLLSKAREVTNDEFVRWEAIATISSQYSDLVIGAQPRLDSWRPVTRDPRHLETGVSAQRRRNRVI